MKAFMKQRGFSVIEIILVIAVIALIGVVGWLFWRQVNTQNTTTNTQQTSNEQSSNTADPAYDGWKDGSLKTSNSAGVTFKLPSDWRIKQTTGDNFANLEEAKITSADGFFVITLTIGDLTRGWTQDSTKSKVLEVQSKANTDLIWVVTDHYLGPNSSKGIQILMTGQSLKVGDEKVDGSSLFKIGEVNGTPVYIEAYGGYEMADLPLEEFNAREHVKQAKLIFESIKF